MDQNHHHFIQLLPLFQQTLLRVGASRAGSATDPDLTYLQMGVLGSVYRQDERTMGQIADENFMTPPAATRIVSDLVDRGLLERGRDPDDRRVVQITITVKGRQALEDTHHEGAAMLVDILAGMTIDEREALIGGLRAFVQAAELVKGQEG